MTIGRAVELAIALGLLVGGVVLYRRGAGADGYGSQGAVIMFVVAAIMSIHALGLLEYRPSPADADLVRERGQ